MLDLRTYFTFDLRFLPGKYSWCATWVQSVAGNVPFNPPNVTNSPCRASEFMKVAMQRRAAKSDQVGVKMMETYLTMHPVRFILIAIAAVSLMMLGVFAFA